jgi:hypothetical protein
MSDFGFVGPSYVAPSIYVNGEECINFRTEIDPTKQAGQNGVVALYPTPGLTTKAVLSAMAEVRGARTVSGGQYAVMVCGPYVYVLTSNLTPTLVGQLNTISGIVGITDNGQNVYIVDGNYRYTWRISNPASAIFRASISGTTLTVSLMQSGTIAIGQSLFGLGVGNEVVITALGTGTGGVGTYTINTSLSIATEQMNSAAVASILTASLGSGLLTITASSGTIYNGQTIQGAGVNANTIITSYGFGTIIGIAVATAGTGYAVNDIITVLGGVYGNTPQTYTITTIGGSGSVTGLVANTVGNYTSLPTNNVSTSTTGSGTGLTLTLSFGSGTGGTGSYLVNNAQTIASETMYALNFSVIPTNDGAFSGADVVDILDNYFIYNNPNTQQFGASNILSPISPALSFASKFTGPDNLVSVIVDHGQIYLLGETTSEVWADVGAFPFPFQRIPGSSSQHGIVAKFSVARVGNSFAYLSKNIRGQAEVVIMNGYFPTRISTHAVENTFINQDVTDARAWTYQQGGHEVYVLSFPTLDISWCYDVATSMWHKWLYCDDMNQYHRHRGNCCINFQNMMLVGDWQNGNIYELDPTNFTDNGQPIRRVRKTTHLVSDYQREYFDELQVYFQPGVGLTGITTPLNVETVGADPQAMMRWSDDGGSNWSNEHWKSIGRIGKYKNRAIWRRLGMTRDRVFELVVTDPINAVIVAANLKSSVGEN